MTLVIVVIVIALWIALKSDSSDSGSSTDESTKELRDSITTLKQSIWEREKTIDSIFLANSEIDNKLHQLIEEQGHLIEALKPNKEEIRSYGSALQDSIIARYTTMPDTL